MNKILAVCLIIGCVIGYFLLTSGYTNGVFTNQTNKTIPFLPTPAPYVFDVKYFTSTNCPLCKNTDELLDNLSIKYPNKMRITELGLTNEGNRNIYAQYTVNVKVKTVPLIVINEKHFLVNYSEIVTHLEPILKGDEFV
jgi:glutaredoxin